MKCIQSFSSLLLLGSCLFSCQLEDHRNKQDVLMYETRYGGQGGKVFSIYLFPDSSFVYKYYPGTQYNFMEKECGVWSLVGSNLTVKQGISMNGFLDVRPENGKSDTLIIYLDESYVREFPNSKLNLFDSINISPIGNRFIVNKKLYFGQKNNTWDNFDNYFVADIKLISGSFYMSIFNTVPTRKISISIPANRIRENPAKPKTLFQFTKEKTSLIEKSSYTYFNTGTLFMRKWRFNLGLCRKLDSLVETDEALISQRDTLLNNGYSGFELDELNVAVANNCDKLKPILDKYGYPGFDLVGEQGAYNCWVILQHSDHDLEFQERGLKLLQNQVNSDNGSKTNLAFLYDRVQINKGKGQLYGTQVDYDGEGQAIPKRLSDAVRVDSLRQSVGLDKLKNYLDLMTLLKGKKKTSVLIQIKPSGF